MKSYKSILLLLLIFAAITITKGQTTNIRSNANDTLNEPEIYFENTIHDYGTIKKNSNGSCKFIFKNTGNEPLVITNVKSSCGCTVPKWSKEAILPDKSGVIKIVYDTKRLGIISKTITVMSNAKTNPVELLIKGTVIE